MEWIKVNDTLPEAGQEVLGYWFDAGYDVDQTILVTYFKKGDVVDRVFNVTIENPEKRLLDLLMNPENEIKAEEDGFYFFEDGWQKHSDCITHWMPIIYPSTNSQVTKEDK